MGKVMPRDVTIPCLCPTWPRVALHRRGVGPQATQCAELACPTLNCKAGANIIVVGNAIEKDMGLLKEMSSAIKLAN